MRPEQEKRAAPGLPPGGTPARPEAPHPRLWKLTGYGKLRSPALPPRSFPHPLEILAARAPARPGFPQLPQPRRRGGETGHLPLTWCLRERGRFRPLDPWVKPSAPWGEPLAPRVKPLASWVRPLAPRVRPLDPRVKPSASWVKPLTPRVKPLASWVRPLAPRVRPLDPRVKPPASGVKPFAPWGEPLTPRVKPLAVARLDKRLRRG